MAILAISHNWGGYGHKRPKNIQKPRIPGVRQRPSRLYLQKQAETAWHGWRFRGEHPGGTRLKMADAINAWLTSGYEGAKELGVSIFPIYIP